MVDRKGEKGELVRPQGQIQNFNEKNHKYHVRLFGADGALEANAASDAVDPNAEAIAALEAKVDEVDQRLSGKLRNMNARLPRPPLC